jgi:prepilin-type N-terminal cleavage/methylation domain-containing protein
MSATPHTSSNGGFTLFEVLIVLAILSVVMGGAVFRVMNIGDRIMISQLADKIERRLTRVANEAAQSGYDRSAEMTPDLLASNDPAQSETAVAWHWTTAAEASSQSDNPTIVFFGSGGSSGGTLEISKGAASAAIQVDWFDGRVHRSR